MRRAVDALARCRTVISKLHDDCLHVAQANAELMTETRNCYLQLCGMVRPSTKSATELQTATTTTQELFRLLVSDVNRLMIQRSKMAEQEQHGRTSAMRVLRKLRDWIVDRCTVLNTLHSSAPSAPLGNSRFLQRRGRLQTQPIAQPQGNYVATYKSLPDNLSTSDDISISDDNHAKTIQKPMLLDVIPSSQPPSDAIHQDFFQGSLFQDHNALVPIAPVASSTPQPCQNNAETSRPLGFNIQPISSVVEGVHQLESQLREYIHLEIILTDRFRQELRRRQQQKKSLGLSSRGISDAQNTLARMVSGSKSNQGEELAFLRSQLDQISTEYGECCQYVDKAVESLTQIEDVESFLKQAQDREQAYRKNRINNGDKQDLSNLKFKTGRKESKAQRREQEAYDALVELFRRGGKKNEKLDRNSIFPKSKDFSPRTKRNSLDNRAPTDSFLTRLKLLVANYEIVRLRMLTLEDRFRREAARRERDTKGLLQGRDEEIFRLQTLLREAEAEKDKYCRLYENTKIATRKR
ncbi:hypothetical protein ElyMa_001759700 [Elysia marginata]|uniref:Uncharacterized protein n=1 Tax=Elysia marginata TaxID=1093978 RepID=A0AAV4EAU9_9GAST|nr:hypothetical protein ElyMa_001759700 [Elysia marginata]